MRIRSLRTLIVGSLLAIHLITSVVFLIVAGQLTRDEQRGFADRVTRNAVENVARHARNFLDQLSRITRLTRGLVEAQVVQTEHMATLERYFFEVLKANPEITGVYYGTLEGEFAFVTRQAPSSGRSAPFYSRTITRDESGRKSVVRLRQRDFDLYSERDLGLTDPYDPRQRPWFARALDAVDVVWTEPYLFYTSGLPGISSGIKVRGPDGEPIGVVGADVSLEILRDFARNLIVGKTGYAFVLDPVGTVISHPGLAPEAHSDLPNFVDIGDPVLDALAAKGAFDGVASESVMRVDGSETGPVLVMTQRLPTSHGDWTIGAVVPESDLFGWFDDMARSAVALAIGLTLLWCLAGLVLWRYIDRRFENLRQLARKSLHVAPAMVQPVPDLAGFSELAETEATVRDALVELEARRSESQVLMERAQRSERAKSDFLANLSHELRTPLNAIGGFAEIIEGEILGPIGIEKYRDYASLIGSSNRRMLALVQNLLDVSALELGTMRPHPDSVNLAGMVADTMAEYRLAAEEGGLTLEVSADPQIQMRADRQMLRLMLGQLVRNALAYTPTGGRVMVSAGMTVSGVVELVVSDTGIGIDPRVIERLRDQLTLGKTDPAVSGAVGAGGGVGLSIVERVVTLHGGRLDFASDSNTGGTRVTVTFPAESVL